MILAHSSPAPTRGLRLGAVLALSASLLAIAPAPASAGDGGAVAAGIIGGVALGALAVGAARAAPPPRRVYVEPAPAYYPAPPPPRYYEEPACGWEMHRVWNGYRWIHERVRVCD